MDETRTRRAPSRRPSGLMRMTLAAASGATLAALGACGSAPTPAFDLSAARAVRGGGGGSIVVPEPSAIQPLEAERIIVKDAAGTISLLPGAQWADRLPRLVQARLIQSFENARGRGVGRPGDGITPDRQLNTDLRAFQLDARTGEAVVEVSAKLVDSRTGQVAAARTFTARTPIGSANAGEVAQALDRSSLSVLTQIVRWSGGIRPAGAAEAGLRP